MFCRKFLRHLCRVIIGVQNYPEFFFADRNVNSNRIGVFRLVVVLEKLILSGNFLVQ